MSTAEVTAAALALPRSARMRLVSALLAENGDHEGAADYEAAARDAEMDEHPARFTAKGSHAAFVAKLRAGVLRRARSADQSPQARRKQSLAA